MNKTYKGDVMAAIHETVSDLHEIGLVDKRTMRHFDEACLTPITNLSSPLFLHRKINDGRYQQRKDHRDE
jgi:DNA-binding transcriptional regulator YiaG